MILVKICGITNPADAEAAVKYGVDFLGVNFVQSSPRYVDPKVAREIVAGLPEGTISVGVFVDESSQVVNSISEEVGLGMVQLHGDESPACAAAINLPVIKAYRVAPSFLPADVSGYPAEAVLLDAYVKGVAGGTGKSVDLDIAAKTGKYAKIMLAGGLSPKNVVEAVKKASPWAVDVNSGIESAPGRKDHNLISDLFDSLRDAGLN